MLFLVYKSFPRVELKNIFLLKIALAISFLAVWIPAISCANGNSWMYMDDWKYDRYEFIFKYKKPIHIAHQNYYAKNEDPAARRMVSDLEKHHYGRIFFEPFYKRNYKEAFDQMKFIFVYMPNHPKALMHIAQIGIIAGNKLLAIPYYQTALQVFPRHSYTYAQYGKYLIDIGFTDHGIKYIKHAIKMKPDVAAFYRILSSTYQKMGKPDLARKAEAEMKKHVTLKK